MIFLRKSTSLPNARLFDSSTTAIDSSIDTDAEIMANCSGQLRALLQALEPIGNNNNNNNNNNNKNNNNDDDDDSNNKMKKSLIVQLAIRSVAKLEMMTIKGRGEGETCMVFVRIINSKILTHTQTHIFCIY